MAGRPGRSEMTNLEKAQTCFTPGFIVSGMAGILVNRAWMVVALVNVLALLVTCIWGPHNDR